jgi:hypothetical protein
MPTQTTDTGDGMMEVVYNKKNQLSDRNRGNSVVGVYGIKVEDE